MNTLVIVAHPSLNETSIANRIIVDRIRALPQVTIKNLHQEYPSFTFNGCRAGGPAQADSVVFQFPFYWYSLPGILKEWMDQVLTYGFAYGSKGDKLAASASSCPRRSAGRRTRIAKTATTTSPSAIC